MKYDAILETVLPETLTTCIGNSFAGLIHEDSATHGNHPFKDGTSIYTSPVMKVIIEPEGIFFETFNTVYKIRLFQPKMSIGAATDKLEAALH